MLASSQRNDPPSWMNDSQLFQGLLGIAEICEAHDKPANGVEVREVRPLDTLKFSTLLGIRYFAQDQKSEV